jgi:hypothetical protein
MASDERREWWKEAYKVFIPLDVDTRWNSIYLIMSVARKYRHQIARFGRDHPTCKHLIPTKAEWSLCEQVKRTMEPFYNHTLTVSNDVPALPQYLSIMWGLTDLLNDVSNSEGQYGDICLDLKAGFKAAKESLQKWLDYMLDFDLVFAAHVLDPRYKFTLIKEQYGDQADEIIERIKTFFKEQYPHSTALPASQELPALDRPHGVLIHEWAMIERARRLATAGGQ